MSNVQPKYHDAYGTCICFEHAFEPEFIKFVKYADDFIDLVNMTTANLSASRQLSLRTLYETTSQRQTDFITEYVL